jgi:His Kinase A (phospho-acceptor) domain/Histidine kinase-, DNA gyrase B-, and HSP90-like ATPase
MLERLDRAFTSQRHFIANATHELRTPLTVMRTAMDVVLAKPEPTREELVSMAAEIRQAVDQAERLIGVLLILARNDPARVLSDPLDLAAVAEDALEGRAANGVTAIITLDEAPVTGDGVLLERLIANLLDNAERYNVANGTVAISTATDDGASLVRVVNTGRVVPPDQVDRLFLPFARLDDRTSPSVSASPWWRRSRPSTAGPFTPPPSLPAAWTSPFVYRAAAAHRTAQALSPPSSARKINVAFTRRLTSSDSGRLSLEKIEFTCFSTARLVSTSDWAMAPLLLPAAISARS